MMGFYVRLVCLLILLSCSSVSWAQPCRSTAGWKEMSAQSVQVIEAGQVKTLMVKVADDKKERSAGYQWICPSTAQNTAVLFIFEREFLSAFHMRNVFVPLDIHFFDALGKQVDALVMRPEPPGLGLKPRYYSPAAAFKYALEIAKPEDHDLQSTPVSLSLVLDTLPPG